jgi:hypothetical protein
MIVDEDIMISLEQGQILDEKCQEFPPRFIETLKVQYRVHKSLPFVPALDHTNPVHSSYTIFLDPF